MTDKPDPDLVQSIRDRLATQTERLLASAQQNPGLGIIAESADTLIACKHDLDAALGLTPPPIVEVPPVVETPPPAPVEPDPPAPVAPPVEPPVEPAPPAEDEEPAPAQP